MTLSVSPVGGLAPYRTSSSRPVANATFALPAPDAVVPAAVPSAKAASQPLGAAGKPEALPDIDALFKASDADGNGVLSKDEFQAFDAGAHPDGSKLWEASTGRLVDGAYRFPLLDRLNRGYLTRAQVDEYLPHMPSA